MWASRTVAWAPVDFGPDFGVGFRFHLWAIRTKDFSPTLADYTFYDNNACLGDFNCKNN